MHSDLGGANLLWTTAAGVPRLTGVLAWDHACIGDQASDLASIAATFALQEALPAALNGDQGSLDEGLRQYR